MKTLPNIICILILVTLGLGLDSRSLRLNVVHADEPAGKAVVFQWAFCTLKRGEAGSQVEVLEGDTTLKSGDQIKFFIKVEKQSYVYLVYQSSQGDLSVLFPYRFQSPGNEYDMSGKHYIPQDSQWFELDENTGVEKFYLLASAERLHELENLINDYESADKAKQAALGNQITDEIRRLRKQHLRFKTYAEKPVTIIGTLRGAEQTKSNRIQDVADYAVEISAKTFFSRTYTIDHQ